MQTCPRDRDPFDRRVLAPHVQDLRLGVPGERIDITGVRARRKHTRARLQGLRIPDAHSAVRGRTEHIVVREHERQDAAAVSHEVRLHLERRQMPHTDIALLRADEHAPTHIIHRQS